MIPITSTRLGESLASKFLRDPLEITWLGMITDNIVYLLDVFGLRIEQGLRWWSIMTVMGLWILLG